MANDNLLWTKHRLYMPGMRDLAIHRCRDCKFLVTIQGREETKVACVVNIKTFGKLEKRIPQIIPIIRVIKLVGLEGLAQCIDVDPEAQSCGRFSQR